MLYYFSCIFVHYPRAQICQFFSFPRAGDANALRSKFSKSAWEGEEQKGANEASEETLEALAKLNDAYLEKNGFIFLICATGKSAAEMLHALQQRISNDSETEVRNKAFLPLLYLSA